MEYVESDARAGSEESDPVGGLRDDPDVVRLRSEMLRAYLADRRARTRDERVERGASLHGVSRASMRPHRRERGGGRGGEGDEDEGEQEEASREHRHEMGG
jgi:hypothetical protein